MNDKEIVVGTVGIAVMLLLNALYFVLGLTLLWLAIKFWPLLVLIVIGGVIYLLVRNK